ncbi:hypothetical protein BANRA_05003 [Escherichia coli]|nr:hypothetical protein BANRA_05003 [Escherichia coli]
MQLFEASLKRTNTMASQGQLWLQLSGANRIQKCLLIWLLHLLCLAMLLALGGNGVAAAAKIFATYPLREYVAAYGSNSQRVCEESRDPTWIRSTLNSQNNAVTWMGLQGLRKRSSYLSVASALYALIRYSHYS